MPNNSHSYVSGAFAAKCITNIKSYEIFGLLLFCQLPAAPFGMRLWPGKWRKKKKQRLTAVHKCANIVRLLCSHDMVWELSICSVGCEFLRTIRLHWRSRKYWNTTRNMHFFDVRKPTVRIWQNALKAKCMCRLWPCGSRCPIESDRNQNDLPHAAHSKLAGLKRALVFWWGAFHVSFLLSDFSFTENFFVFAHMRKNAGL